MKKTTEINLFNFKESGLAVKKADFISKNFVIDVFCSKENEDGSYTYSTITVVPNLGCVMPGEKLRKEKIDVVRGWDDGDFEILDPDIKELASEVEIELSNFAEKHGEVARGYVEEELERLGVIFFENEDEEVVVVRMLDAEVLGDE